MYFGAGGALGFDTLAAQCVLSLKNQYTHIKLILVLPCITQTKGWSENDIAIYEEIKSQADKVVYTSRSIQEAVCLRGIAIWLIAAVFV